MQVGHITCDNASNNTTMLEEFARCHDLKTKSSFDFHCRHIRYMIISQILHFTDLYSLHRCMVDIINLATQAVISTCSKVKFYSGDPEDDVISEPEGEVERDEVGLVRAICVKVCGLFLAFLLFLT